MYVEVIQSHENLDFPERMSRVQREREGLRKAESGGTAELRDWEEWAGMWMPVLAEDFLTAGSGVRLHLSSDLNKHFMVKPRARKNLNKIYSQYC